MTPVCLVCTHADRGAIEAELVRGTSVRRIGARFGVSKDSVQNHKGHLSPALAKVLDDLDATR